MDVSIDLETAGNTTDSAILSIGAYAVNGVEEEPDRNRSFYVNVDLQSCIDAGMKVTGSTIYWWLKQSAEARERLVTPAQVDINVALQRLDQWFKVLGDPRRIRVWAHATFDPPILHHAYQLMGWEPPWKYWQVHDLRTLEVFSAKARDTRVKANGLPHDALWDAFAQGQQVAAAFARKGSQ